MITGGNAGIGRETAVGLATRGASVVLAVRNPTKGDEAVADIRARTGNDDVAHLPLDLASLASVRAFDVALRSRTDRLHVLVNNAGVVLLRRQVTADGFESTFGVNHLGHFLLTELVRDLLLASAPARAVIVASDAHKGARRGLDFADLQTERRYNAMKAYCRSKLANLLHLRELARRLDGTGVTANAVHPGAVATRLARDGDAGVLGDVAMRLSRPFFRTPAQGAHTSIHVAAAPELEDVNGGYFADLAPTGSTRWATDDAAARRLWDISARLVGAP